MPKLDLLPCPFCGSDNVRIVKSEALGGMFLAGCSKCNVSTAFYAKEKYAAAVWNTRASGWIPCSERMPEDDEEVLFAFIYPWDKKTRVTLGRRRTKKSGESWWANSYCHFSDYDVTHWMPLPEAPQRKDDTHDND